MSGTHLSHLRASVSHGAQAHPLDLWTCRQAPHSSFSDPADADEQLLPTCFSFLVHHQRSSPPFSRTPPSALHSLKRPCQKIGPLRNVPWPAPVPIMLIIHMPSNPKPTIVVTNHRTQTRLYLRSYHHSTSTFTSISIPSILIIYLS
jgi:hypothetical protein